MKKLTIILLFIFLMGTLVYAQEEETLKLTLKQAQGNKEVKDVLINIGILEKQSNSERTISSFIRSNPITLRLPKGEYILTFKIDNLQTPGKDFYAQEELVVDKSIDKEIIVFPVGSITGTVFDTLNNLISQATLKVECSKEYGEQAPKETDKVGSFSLAYAPVGECTVTATSNNAAGTGKVTIEQGVSKNLEIRMDRAVISESGNGWIISWAIILLAIVGAAGWFGWKYWQKRPQKQKEMQPHKPLEHQVPEQQEEKHSKRTKDILDTLNEKEAKVVMFLLNNQQNSTQAKIRYETAIPKTTLVRVFTSLQNKKIISIETVGKLKKIKLTSWFLEKEN